MLKCTPLALLLCLVTLAAGDGKEEIVVTEISLADVPAAIVQGKPTMPTTITTAEELAKVFADESVAARIKKDIDFEKQKLVYFAWSGSGQDKLTHSIVKDEKDDKKEVVKFQYHPGRTRDLRGHHKLYALPKDAAFVVAAGR